MSEIWVKSEANQWLDRVDAVIAEACLDTSVHLGALPVALEVGVHLGGWTSSLAINSSREARYFGIDPYPSSPEIRKRMEDRFADLDISDRYTHFASWHELESASFAADVMRSVALIHLDGEHTQSALELDLEHASEFLAELGIIAIDDISNPWFPGVPAATYAFLAQGSFALLLQSRAKVYICRGSQHSALRQELRTQLENRDLVVQDFVWQSEADQLGYREPQSVFGYDALLCVASENLATYPEYANAAQTARLSSRTFAALAPPVLQEWMQRRGLGRK